MAKKTNLSAALQSASGKPLTNNEIKPSVIKESPVGTPPSRRGKKAITGFFDPIVSRQLKQIALNEDTTVQLLVAEALNDLFVKHNQKPIA
jgi:hypothetical protein